MTPVALLLRRSAACVASSATHGAPSQPSVLLASKRSMGHTVRIILKEDLPNGKGYSGEVLTVKAGYARNHLIPKKLALYAIPANFERLGIQDPENETLEQRRARKASEASTIGDEDLKAADLLRFYLRNKVLKIWRNADPITGAVFPGKVNSVNVRDKLSRQLKIDLENHETVHLRAEPVVGFAEISDDQIDEMLNHFGTAGEDGEVNECQVEIRQLGEYLAKISLRGGYSVPLKISVKKR